MAKLRVYEKKKPAKELYQIHISLRWITPKIWRRVLMPANMKLSDLHKVMQTVMGWTNTHLHQFVKDNEFYRKKTEEDIDWGYVDEIDYKNIRVSDLISSEKDSMEYEYDFGDGWVHKLVLEKIIPNDKEIVDPVCLKGKRSSPPEDCGGPPGYGELLDALKNPEHERHKELTEWVGDYFDPEEFDLDEVNDCLKEDDYGCLDMLI